MTFALQILCVFGLIACGFYARRRGIVSGQGTGELARLTTDIIYPALIFVSVTRLSADDLIGNALLPVLVMGIALVGFALGLIAVRFLGRVSPDTARAFLFHCLMNNYLFLPLPLVLFLYGERGVALLVYSSLGYELVLWTVGVLLFTKGATVTHRMRQLLSPPFVTLLASLGLVFLRDKTGFELRGVLAPLAESFVFIAQMLGQATVAMSVIVAGSRFAVLKRQTMLGWRVWLVSVIRLVLVPLILLPLLHLVPLDPMTRGILFIIAVMPSAMVSIIFSERYGGDSEFIAGGLLLTHLWALITVPLFLAFVL